jgi:HEPN domain-containing protein
MVFQGRDQTFKKTYAIELLRIAFGDLESAKALHSTGRGRPENVCYLAQQVIEKSLKAALVWRQIAFPLIHDSNALVAKLPQQDLPPHGYDLGELNQFATVRRYEEGRALLTNDQVQAALGVAEEVWDWANRLVGPIKPV